MTATITVRSHQRKKSAAAQVFEDLRRKRLDQLQREIEAKKAQAKAEDDRLESILAESIVRDASDVELEAEIASLRSGIPVLDHVPVVKLKHSRKWMPWFWRRG